MTQSFGVNASNDLYIGANGNLVILQGQSAVEVACANVSRASLGEEVLSVGNGLPFFQAVFNGVPNLAVFENYLRTALLSVDGVLAVTNLTTRVGKNDLEKNTLFYIATIENVYGLAFEISGGVPSP